jgi:ABC-2 type transport system ATP-binding protein
MINRGKLALSGEVNSLIKEGSLEELFMKELANEY